MSFGVVPLLPHRIVFNTEYGEYSSSAVPAVSEFEGVNICPGSILTRGSAVPSDASAKLALRGSSRLSLRSAWMPVMCKQTRQVGGSEELCLH